MLEVLGFLFALFSFIFPRILIASYVDRIFLKKRYWLYIIFFHMIASRYVVAFSWIGVITLYYLVFHIKSKLPKRLALFFALYISVSYSALYFFGSSILYRSLFRVNMPFWMLQGTNLLLMLILLVVAITLMNYFNFDKRVLATKELSKNIISANVILLFLNGLRVISSLLIAHKNSFFVTFDTTVALVIFVGYLLTISHLHERQLQWLHQEQIKQKEQENRDLNVMVTNLGDLYDQIRAFRHDFGNIIGSLGPAIETGTREEINDVYEQVLLETNTVLRKADYSAFNLKNIEDIAFRNVLAQKMVQAKNAHISFYLECRQTIPKVEVPMLETIRLLSILLDNAMEEAIFAEEPRISVAITHLDATTTFSVQNTRQRGTIDQRKIWEAGYSTKGENRGLGLATVLDIQK